MKYVLIGSRVLKPDKTIALGPGSKLCFWIRAGPRAAKILFSSI